MRASERTLVACVVAAACALAACDALLQLGKFSVVDCDGSCDGMVGDVGADVQDGESSVYPADALDGPGDAGDATDLGDATPSDASDGAAESSIPDGPLGAPPTASELWVNWPMPNPDAAIAPGSDAALPHPMTYDVTAADAGYVRDAVTHLIWETGVGATDVAHYLDAHDHCSHLPQVAGFDPWRVPTRIELVSLIDFTRTPTFDVDAFGIPLDAGPNAGSGTYWTSSLWLPDGDAISGDHWVVSFSDGLVTSGTASAVRCVSERAP